MENLEIQQDDELDPSNDANYNILSLDLIRRIMKVKHIQASDKAIRKFQRELTKMNEVGSLDEIKEAKTKLEEDKMESKIFPHGYILAKR